MKKCPVCNQIYTGDDDFCVGDGTALVPFSPSGQPTVQYHSTDAPTVVVPTPGKNPVERRSENNKVLYIVIGAMGAALAAMAIFMFVPKDAASPETSKKERAIESPTDADRTPSPPSRTSAAEASSPVPLDGGNPPRPALSPGGTWNGDWSSPSGAYFTLKINLTDDGTGKVEGQIEWTMRRTTRPDKMSKIGSTAIEYVRGRFDPASKIFTMKGYSKSDPNNMLVMLDDYRLSLSANSQTLNGAARNGGKWDGKLNLSRY